MAPTRCDCDRPRLTVVLSLAERGVPHGSAGHDIIYDYTRVSECSECGGGVVEHFSHDCWDIGDHADYDKYWWWRVDMDAIRELVRACPAPLDPGCGCPVHQGLGAGSPNPLPPSAETPYDDVTVPRAGVRVVDGVPRWA
ncbi:hypothetical protein [Actinomadura miaoliensis]|uniref:Uncharacterized protein n=1 Tax=Actinomadura miaoliensis TaxID=430685 RepID=A0ABP7VB20_9ACTN